MKTKLRLLLNDLLYRRTHCTGTNVWYHKEEVDKTITEILSLVKECAPEEMEVEKIIYSDVSNGSGSIGNQPGQTIIKVEQQFYEIKHTEWNAAIKQFLANIEGEK